jgi:hypothetical protein
MIFSRVAFETRVTFAGRGMPIPKNSNGRLNIAGSGRRGKIAITI